MPAVLDPRGNPPLTIAGMAGRNRLGPGRFASSVRTPQSGAAGQTFGVRLKDPPTGHLPIAVVGDNLNIKALTPTGVVENWWRVNSVSDPGSTAGFYYYNVTRMSGPPATFPAGAAVANWGQSGQGVISLSTDGGIGAQPNISILTHSGQPWNSTTLLSRWGNLNGSYGKVADVIGIGIGDYSGGNYLLYDTAAGFTLKAGGNNITIDTNGISIAANAATYLFFGTSGAERAAISTGAASGVQGVFLAAYKAGFIGSYTNLQLSDDGTNGWASITSGGTTLGLIIGPALSYTTLPNAMLDVRGTGQIGTTSGGVLQLGYTPGGNNPSKLQFISTNATLNWQISNNAVVSGGLEFIPSTTNGGNTFTTPSMCIDGNARVGIGLTSLAARLHVSEPTIGNDVARFESVATNDDPRESIVQQRVTTTDGTTTNILVYNMTNSVSVKFQAHIVARRTGGASGTAEDSAAYTIDGIAKAAAGTTTLIGNTTTTVGESQVAWNAAAVASGNTVLFQVTGAASNNVVWHITLHYWPLST